jgi:hypothetical protein
MVSQNRLQGRVQQVGGRMVAGSGGAMFGIYG